MDQYIFPIIPSPHDSRDYIYENIQNLSRSVIDTIDLRNKMLKPRNQGNRGTCAAFAASAIKEYQERIDINLQEYISPEFIYFHRQNKPNPGMFCRDVMKILKNYGSVKETSLPYATTEPLEISKDILKEAESFKINSYASITTIEGLKDALINHGPCLISFPVYSGSPEFWRASSADDKQRGGHAVCIVGFTKEGFILRNSWGSLWNGDGCVIYPYVEFGKHWEIWCCLDIDNPEWLPDPPKKWYKSLLAFCKN